MYDIVIIGAGPAGLTAAIYAARANKKVLVLEAKNYGGQIVNTPKIDNYPGMPHVSGAEFAACIYNQVIELGVEVVFEKAINIQEDTMIKKVFTKDNIYQCKSIIIATGVDKRKLNVDGEKEYLGKGVSYCATCDGMFFRGKNVAVIGGGEAALEDAEFLSNICDKVYLIHRRDKFRASDSIIRKVESKTNINFILNSNVIKINGNEFVESIDVKKDVSEIINLKVDGVFIAVGQVPETSNIIKDLEKNSMGYIIAGEDTSTNIAGVFVAGDVREKKLRQLTTAVSDGSEAAVMACNYINGK